MQAFRKLPAKYVIWMALSVAPSAVFAHGEKCLSLFDTNQKIQIQSEVKKLSDLEAIMRTQSIHMLQEAFIDFLVSKEGEVVSEEKLKPWTDAIQKEVETYFKESGIEFSSIEQTYGKINFMGAQISKLKMTSYQLQKVSDPKDSIGVSVNEVLLDEKLKGIALIYNPFLHILKQDLHGTYISEEKKITISYQVLANKLAGVADTLGHETIHAYEDVRLHAGEDTLASFILGNHRQSEPYKRILHLDEIEAHLEDVRFLVKAEEQIKKVFPSSHMQEMIVTAKDAKLKEVTTLIHSFISSSKKVLMDLKRSVAVNGPGQQGVNGNLQVYQYALPQNPEFPLVAVRFVSQKDVDPRQTVLAKIDWALNRINEVEVELHRLLK